MDITYSQLFDFFIVGGTNYQEYVRSEKCESSLSKTEFDKLGTACGQNTLRRIFCSTDVKEKHFDSENLLDIIERTLTVAISGFRLNTWLGSNHEVMIYGIKPDCDIVLTEYKQKTQKRYFDELRKLPANTVVVPQVNVRAIRDLYWSDGYNHYLQVLTGTEGYIWYRTNDGFLVKFDNNNRHVYDIVGEIKTYYAEEEIGPI